MLKAHILFLEKKGYEVVTASNGPDAIDYAREGRFDLVLLDENMPGLSGLETLTRLKEIAPTLPVVMVTKNEEEDIMDQAIGSKIADYLIKPVNPKQILLTLKKNIHQREIVQEVTQTGYRQEFGRIGMQLSESLTADEWKELYKRLVYWELELSEADSAMDDMLRMQKEEANLTFAKFVRRNYEDWIKQPDERPLMSPDIFKHCVFPRLSDGRKVFLLVLDNFRYDQWRVLSSELADDFDIDEDLYYTILPTATQYARNAIFAGLMPLQIKQMYPDLWVDEEEDEGKNLNEEALIRHQLERFRRRETFTYHKLNDSDHGSIRVDQPSKVVGDKNVNTNLRYKLGRNLSYNAKEVFEVRNPKDLLLPQPNLSTSYIFATGNRFFAYPNNYNYYVQYYRDTFQHGGISMEEMLVPLVTLRSKSKRRQ